MKLHQMILSRIFLLSLFFFLKNIINCQSFLPVSYATHQLYSFDKVTPHEIKRNLKNTVGNFIARKLKDIKSKFNSYKNYVHDGDMDNDNNNNGYNSNNNDITKHDYNESLGEEVKSLLQQARNKRKLSKKIKESYERALKNLQKRKNDNSGDYNDNDEKTSKILQHNLEQINYLNKKSNYLENRAEELKKYLKISTNQNYEQVNNCNISKTGKLKFVSSSNGLKHSIDNVEGKINNNGFTIFYKKKKNTQIHTHMHIHTHINIRIHMLSIFDTKSSNGIFKNSIFFFEKYWNSRKD